MLDKKALEIIDFVRKHHEVSSKEIFDGISGQISYATVKRLLHYLTDNHLLSKKRPQTCLSGRQGHEGTMKHKDASTGFSMNLVQLGALVAETGNNNQLRITNKR